MNYTMTTDPFRAITDHGAMLDIQQLLRRRPHRDHAQD
jgi:hypothetical protein